MTATKSTPINFENSLTELENLVGQMEKGELSLEESLKHFERGIELAKTCQSSLREAEQKVEMLMKKDGETEIVPFDTQG